jgi:hypothetical protein
MAVYLSALLNFVINTIGRFVIAENIKGILTGMETGFTSNGLVGGIFSPFFKLEVSALHVFVKAFIAFNYLVAHTIPFL